MEAISFHHLATDIPGQKISGAQWQATLYNVAEKTCYVAFLAILGVVLALSYQLVALAETTSLIVAGSALLSPFLLLAPVKFAQMRQFYERLAEDDTQVLQQFQQIERWDQPEIEGFFRREGLRAHIPPQPRTLLPLIARFEMLKARAAAIQNEARASFASLEENFARQNVDPLTKQKIRFENMCTHHARLEAIAMPAALQAATILQLIQNPTMLDLDVDPEGITGVGTWTPRPYPERVFAKTQPNYDDTYFQFLPALNRPALTHAQIEQTGLDPATLRLLLYPRG